MIDHFVLLTPLILLPILLLFAFVGCAFDSTGQQGPGVLLVHPDVLLIKKVESLDVTFTWKSSVHKEVPTSQTYQVHQNNQFADFDWVYLSWTEFPEVEFEQYTVTCKVTVNYKDGNSKKLHLSEGGLSAGDVGDQHFELTPNIASPSDPLDLKY